MATSFHTIGARTIAIANGIEERTKVSHVDGKAYSIVTDQLGTPTEAYNAEGEEVWSRRLDMNGKYWRRNTTNMPHTASKYGYHSYSKDSTTTTRRSWHTTDSDTTHRNSVDISLKTRSDLRAEN